MSRLAILFFALVLVTPVLAQDQARVTWSPGAETFTLAAPEASWSMDVTAAELDSLTVLNLPVEHEGHRLSGALYGAADTLHIVPDGPGVYGVRLTGLDREKAIDFVFQWPPTARFTEAYRHAYEGTSRIEIPEVYELVNIAFALTPTGRDTSNVLVWRTGPYYDRVMAHFGPYADHPLVAEMERVLQAGAYVNVRANAYAFDFDGDRIVPDAHYVALAFGKARLDALVPQLESFAAATGFRAFYEANRAAYDRQVAEMKRLLPVRQMWEWLEAEFSVRRQSYVTLFSPLSYGTHSAAWLDGDGYSETVVFLAGPGTLDDDFGSVVGKGTEAWREVEMSRIAFTEYDHAYVNPAMGTLANEIDEAMADLDPWNRLPLYRSASETFGEYMTWAVFLLYVDAHYPADTAAEARAGVVRFMESNRGFSRFGRFLDALTVLYEARAEGETLADLMPSIIRWAARQ